MRYSFPDICFIFINFFYFLFIIIIIIFVRLFGFFFTKNFGTVFIRMEEYFDYFLRLLIH